MGVRRDPRHIERVDIMIYLLAFMVCALGCALNTAVYVDSGNAINLGVAVFCGALALWNLGLGISDHG